MRSKYGYLVVGAGAAVFAVVTGFVIFAASVSGYAPRSSEPVDGIVVLTGGEKRVQEGLRLFSEAKAKRILISGVNRATTRDDLKRNAPLSSVLYDCCVDIGYEALDTIGNAEEARGWIETWNFRRVAIVTSNYHMPRSLVEFSRAMPSIEFVPQPVASPSYRSAIWWLQPGTIRIVTIEYLKFIPAAARWGLTWILGPGRASEISIPGIEEPDGSSPADGRTPPRRVSGM